MLRPYLFSSFSIADRAVRFALEILLPQGLSLVVEFFSFDERDLRLHPSALEVELQRNAREAASSDLGGPPVELAAVHQDLAVPLRDVTRPRRGPIGRDVRADEVGLGAAKVDKRVLEVCLAAPQRFHFASREREADLELALDEKIVKRLPIRRHDLRLAGPARASGLHFRSLCSEAMNSPKRTARSGSNCVPAFEAIRSTASSRLIAGR